MRLVSAISLGLFLLFGMSLSVDADVPTSMNVQGRLTDPAGAPLPAGPKNFAFQILDDLSKVIWPKEGGPEPHIVSTDSDGLWTATLGTLEPIDESVFAEPGRWLEVTVDDGASPPETLPLIRLVTGPFAFHVATLDGATGGWVVGSVTVQDNLTAGGKITSGNSITIDGVTDQITATGGTISFDDDNLVTTGKATIGSGHTNTAAHGFVAGTNNSVSGFAATIGGGWYNIASGQRTVVGGGEHNRSVGAFAAIGGGRYNRANGEYAVVAGGGGPDPSDSNAALGVFSAIGGGIGNRADDTASTVGGGKNCYARGKYATVAGGGGWTTVADSNSAGGNWSFIGGGSRNSASGGNATISGGFDNIASGNFATVGGGQENAATGMYSVVPGGWKNTAAGVRSFAAGASAKANHNGAIVLSANSGTTFDSVRSGGDEQFVVFADGGIYLTNTPELAPYTPGTLITTQGGASLSGNGTTWTDASDRNLKENFQQVDAARVLDLVAELPISEWNYKSESNGIRRIGPMGQDFYRLFGLGPDDKSISPRDLASVALVAVQELDRKVRRIEELESELGELRSLVQDLLSDRR